MLSAELQNRLFSSYTRAEWVIILRDKQGRRGTLRWLGYLWRRWTVLPGDVWWNFSHDLYIIVHSGRPGRVNGRVVSGQMLKAYGREVCEDNSPVERVVLR